ncbi:MAG TPA: hypothetical protein VGG46_16420 [Terriglobales bacterium]
MPPLFFRLIYTLAANAPVILAPTLSQSARKGWGTLEWNERAGHPPANLSVASVRTPIVLVGIQPKLYSHSNWVGLNPFTFVSGVEVQCEEVDGGFTKVTVRVNRLRAVLWVAFWIACSLLAARAMPEPGGAILVIGVACAAWFGLVCFLGGYLIKKEISDRLKKQ